LRDGSVHARLTVRERRGLEPLGGYTACYTGKILDRYILTGPDLELGDQTTF